MEKEENLIPIECETTEDKNVRVYKYKGSVIRVRREFAKGGRTILEGIVSILVDMMEKENEEKINTCDKP